jgi:hypothetical protein
VDFISIPVGLVLLLTVLLQLELLEYFDDVPERRESIQFDIENPTVECFVNFNTPVVNDLSAEVNELLIL